MLRVRVLLLAIVSMGCATTREYVSIHSGQSLPDSLRDQLRGAAANVRSAGGGEIYGHIREIRDDVLVVQEPGKEHPVNIQLERVEQIEIEASWPVVAGAVLGGATGCALAMYSMPARLNTRLSPDANPMAWMGAGGASLEKVGRVFLGVLVGSVTGVLVADLIDVRREYLFAAPPP